MEKEYDKQNKVKIVFSIISLLMMVPSLTNPDEGYYRTLFIFLINRVIDMFSKGKSDEHTFFVVWTLFNQWFGAVACAFAFCSIMPDFAEVCKDYSEQINMVLFICAISCVLKELLVLIVASIQESFVKVKIKNDMSETKGESL